MMNEREQKCWKEYSSRAPAELRENYCGVRLRPLVGPVSRFEYIPSFSNLWKKFSVRSIAQRKRYAKR